MLCIDYPEFVFSRFCGLFNAGFEEVVVPEAKDAGSTVGS